MDVTVDSGAMSQSGEPEPSADDRTLDQLADDLAGVEEALERLDHGSGRTDELSPPPGDAEP
jgi:hypothetical protein